MVSKTTAEGFFISTSSDGRTFDGACSPKHAPNVVMAATSHGFSPEVEHRRSFDAKCVFFESVEGIGGRKEEPFMPWETIVKSERDWPVAPNLLSYETARSEFSWETARRELAGLPGGGGLNIAHEAVDRHAAGTRSDHLALRWLGKAGEIRDYTYAQLRSETNRFANVLEGLGVKKGDRVFVLSGASRALHRSARDTQEPESLLSAFLSVRAGADPGQDGDRSGKGAGDDRVALPSKGRGDSELAAHPRACPGRERW